jgi:glycosyltransferase involved in cell wall biosynthesis
MSNLKISYAILTHNEGLYIESLLEFLIKNKREEDEIIVVDDHSEDELTKSILNKYSPHIKLYFNHFEGDASQKNFASEKCTGDFIFQLDADEILGEDFLKLLPEIINKNSELDLLAVPRVNIVEGLTHEWIEKWKWNVNEKGWVNFPDWQLRIYKNCEWVKWNGLLHGTVSGYKKYAFLPPEEKYSILHKKKLDRQILQNNLYDKIEALGKNKYKV